MPYSSPLDLPTDAPRGASVASGAGTVARRQARGAAGAAALDQAARRIGRPIAEVALAAWAVLLARHARAGEVTVATADGARTFAFPEGATLADVLAAARVAPRDAGTPPQLAFAWGGQPAAAGELSLAVAVDGDDLVATLDHDAALHGARSADRLLGRFAQLVAALPASLDRAAARLPLLPPGERAELVAREVAPSAAPRVTVHARFAAQAARTPDAVALSGAGEPVTYAQLERESARLAAWLRARGVGRGARVGLAMARTPRFVAAALATLRAGGAYVPLEPGYPRERLAAMLEDVAPAIVLADDASIDAVRGLAEVVALDTAWDAIVAADALPPADEATRDDAAYVMFTSGSTGRPKGVEVPHRAIVRLVAGTDFVPLDASTVTLGFAPTAFDASTLELWGALLEGGRVALMPEALPTSDALGAFIVRERVNTVWLTSALFSQFVERAPWALGGVRALLAGGDVLSPAHVQRALDALPEGAVMVNGYGPTENTTFSTTHAMPARSVAPSPVPIGRPIPGSSVRIVEPSLDRAPIGVPGELLVGGDGLALGYVGRPDLTAERFVTIEDERFYRTGDLARWRDDGTIEFMGRLDAQVKVRGYRIEPGEVESALLAEPSVAEAAVVAVGGVADRRLVAFVVARAGAAVDPRALRDALARRLPDYMVPSRIVALDAMPVSATGKVDRRALAAMAPASPAAAPATAPSRDDVAALVAATFAAVLGVAQVGPRDHFFELGGDSLAAVRAAERLGDRLGAPVSPVLLFECPTVESLAARLGGADAPPAREPAPPATPARREPAGDTRHMVAIVGMAGRFPGAPDVATLWRNLREGRESTTDFGRDGVDPLVPREMREHPDYVASRGIIDGVDQFASEFFGVNPRLADVTDPQHRVFLEVAHEALEHAGLAPGRFRGDVGVFAGMGYNAYYPTYVATRPDLVATVGALPVQLANEKDYVAISVAHKLDLTGPAVSVHTACSTSLVAVAQAVQALLTGQCDAAIAGGVAITFPQKSGWLYAEGSMLSPDGRCRPFDVDARGTSFNDGAAAVVLKRLDDALADGDHVWAVIRGAAVNNDGGHKASFSAPSVSGQAAVIERALKIAGVDPATISYVEAHGTATPLGDPIEVEALTRAYRKATDRRGFCALGSVKGNIGHLTAAAGVTGLIKVALALHHGELPPSINFTAPNPRLKLDESPFFVQASLAPWRAEGGPRRAAVSSFGVGGTNAHVIVEEAPARAAATPPARPAELLVYSAKTTTALDAVTARLGAALAGADRATLAHAAWSLADGRVAHAERAFAVAADGAEAAALLAEPRPGRTGRAKAAAQPPRVAFLFPGQGAQHVGMARDLYELDAGFRATVDRCAAHLLPLLGEDLRAAMWPAGGDPEAAAARLTETRLTQPALFVVGVALGELWRRWGVEPAALMGHSIGEFAAACLAGVFSLEDGLTLVAHRGRLLQACEPGTMLSVRLPADELVPRLPADVSLAAHNAPSLSVVSGPRDAIARVQASLEAAGVTCRPLHTSHAFHSAMVEPAVAPFEAVVRGVVLSPPALPVVSCVTGTWLTAGQATDPAYWARHLRATVRFADGLATLRGGTGHLFLEVGPRQVASTFARSVPVGTPVPKAIPSLGDGAEPGDAWRALLGAAGQLWCAGAPLDWTALYGPAVRRRVPLPVYPFERRRHWVEPGTGAVAMALTDTMVAAATAGSATRDVALPLSDGPPNMGEAVVEDVIARQLALMREQLALLSQSS